MKNKTMKKLLAFALTAVISASLLSGCGNNAEESGVSQSSESKAEQSSAVQSTQSGGVQSSEVAEDAFEHDPVLNELGAEPVCNEKVTITIGIKSHAKVEDYDTNYYTQMLEEAGNVDIEFVVYPAGDDAQEKLQMMIAGGEELPDILLWAQTDALAMSWGEEGYLIPLEEYFENSTYYFEQGRQKVLQSTGLDVLGSLKSSDGHIWTFPSYQETLTNPTYCRFYVYQPWLEALNLEAPTTTEELRDVLMAFKTQDPNGNGKADEIPLLGCAIDANYSGAWAWEYMMNAFTHVTSRRNFLVSTDGKLSMSYTTEGWKEGVKYISSLVEEGLYDTTSFTQDTAMFQSIMNSTSEHQLIGAFSSMSTSIIAWEHPSKEKWLQLAPLKGPDGYQSISYNPDLPEATAYITSYCEHPEVAFRLLDLMCREDFTITSRWGKQGENWDYIANLNEEELEAKASEANGVEVEYDWENARFSGYPAYVYEYKSIWNEIQNYHWRNMAVRFRTGEITGGFNAATERFDEATRSNPVNAYTQTDFLNETLDLIPKEPIGKILYKDLDASVEAEEILAELNEYVYESLINWFVGKSDVEADWDAYLKELETIGLSRYLELAQERWGE